MDGFAFVSGRRQRSRAAPEGTAKLLTLPPTPPLIRRALVSEAPPTPCPPSPHPRPPRLYCYHHTRVVGVCGLRVGEAASSQPASLPVPAEEQPNVLFMSKPATPPPPAHPSLDPAASAVLPICPSAGTLVKRQVSRTPSSSTFISALQSPGCASEKEEEGGGGVVWMERPDWKQQEMLYFATKPVVSAFSSRSFFLSHSHAQACYR